VQVQVTGQQQRPRGQHPDERGPRPERHHQAGGETPQTDQHHRGRPARAGQPTQQRRHGRHQGRSQQRRGPDPVPAAKVGETDDQRSRRRRDAIRGVTGGQPGHERDEVADRAGDRGGDGQVFTVYARQVAQPWAHAGNGGGRALLARRIFGPGDAPIVTWYLVGPYRPDGAAAQ
jgi:hypothetical protein